MMKRFKLGNKLFPLLALGLAIAAVAQGEKLLDPGAQACFAYQEKANLIMPNTDPEFHFGNREKAEEALSFLEKYPSVPGTNCDLILAMRASRALFDFFQKEPHAESARLASVTKLVLQDQVDPANLITYLVHADIFSAYLEKIYQGKDQGRLLNAVKALVAEGESIRYDLFRDRKKNARPESEALKREQAAVKPENIKLQALILKVLP